MFSFGIELIKQVITTRFKNLSKIMNAGDLGVLLSICKHGFTVCEGAKVEIIPLKEYMELVVLVLQIINNGDLKIFLDYCELL